MHKIFKLILFSSLAFLFVFVFVANNSVNASNNICRDPDACPPMRCPWTSCGDKCRCHKNVCDDFTQKCNWCDPLPCDQIFGTGWQEGSCGAEQNCEMQMVRCNCGNVYACHHTIVGTPPTDIPPSPTPTSLPPPPTATPTPIQPTVIITIPIPSPTVFSNNSTGTGINKLGQSWICIESLPCSQQGVICSGGNKEHRVLIQTKNGTSLKMGNTPTYVFECLSPDQKSYKCTTGNDRLDQTLISKSNLPFLRTDYGYSFISYTDTKNNPIDQTGNINSVPKTTTTGTFGPYEWESKTDALAWRLIMTMQDLDWKAGLQGAVGAQQQGTVQYVFDKNNQICIIIKWDPQGIIYNIDSLRPVEGVKVTLYVKNDAGIFVPMQDKKWGLLANPILSSPQGNYQFFVPAGTYKIAVEKKGYELVTNKDVTSIAKKINNIYNGGEIVTKGEIQEVNILMKKKSLFHSIVDVIESLFTHEK